jgi:hypothetical protein
MSRTVTAANLEMTTPAMLGLERGTTNTADNHVFPAPSRAP